MANFAANEKTKTKTKTNTKTKTKKKQTKNIIKDHKIERVEGYNYRGQTLMLKNCSKKEINEKEKGWIKLLWKA